MPAMFNKGNQDFANCETFWVKKEKLEENKRMSFQGCPSSEEDQGGGKQTLTVFTWEALIAFLALKTTAENPIQQMHMECLPILSSM